MSKPTILLHKCKLPVFKATLWIIVGDTVKNAMEFVEDKISEKIIDQNDKKFVRAYMYAYETEKNKRHYMVFFRYTARPGEIAHEVKHVINMLFKWHGVNLSLSNDEMECYYLEILVDKCHNILSKYKRMYKRGKSK
jgi:hypothetical protein